MAYFEDLNLQSNTTIQEITSSQNLCKLIYYNTLNPLSETNLTQNERISLLFNKIFPMPNWSFAEDCKDSRLCIYFGESTPYDSNSGFRPINLYIDVICHLDVWKITSGMRPYLILNELDKLFNNQKISNISINKIYFLGLSPPVKFADYFFGYTLNYKVSTNSNIECS